MRAVTMYLSSVEAQTPCDCWRLLLPRTVRVAFRLHLAVVGHHAGARVLTGAVRDLLKILLGWCTVSGAVTPDGHIASPVSS